MAEPPAAHVVHSLPGRLRLRLPELQGDLDRLSALALAVAGLPGVATARATGLTGSLLIQHGNTPEALLASAAAAGLFLPADAPPPAEAASPTLPEGLLPAAGAVATAGLAALQLLRKEALPPALTLAYYALMLGQEAMRQGFGAALMGTPPGSNQPRSASAISSASQGSPSRPT